MVRTPTGLWLVDLLSTDGTIVNGHVVPLASLRSGDEFQVGRFLVAVRYEEGGDCGRSAPADRSGRGGSLNGLSQQATRERTPVTSDFDQAEPGRLSALNQLARLTADRQHADGVPAPVEGRSEEHTSELQSH